MVKVYSFVGQMFLFMITTELHLTFMQQQFKLWILKQVAYAHNFIPQQTQCLYSRSMKYQRWQVNLLRFIKSHHTSEMLHLAKYLTRFQSFKLIKILNTHLLY